jgi:hypothetical protein
MLQRGHFPGGGKTLFIASTPDPTMVSFLVDPITGQAIEDEDGMTIRRNLTIELSLYSPVYDPITDSWIRADEPFFFKSYPFEEHHTGKVLYERDSFFLQVPYNGETNMVNRFGTAKALLNGPYLFELRLRDWDWDNGGELIAMENPLLRDMIFRFTKAGVIESYVIWDEGLGGYFPQYFLTGNTTFKEFYFEPTTISKYMKENLGYWEPGEFAARSYTGHVINILDADGNFDEENVIEVMGGEEQVIRINEFSTDETVAELPYDFHIDSIGECKLVMAKYNGSLESNGEFYEDSIDREYTAFWSIIDKEHCLQEYIEATDPPDPTGIDALSLEKQINRVSSNGDFRFAFEDASLKGTYEVFNMTGQLVRSGEFANGAVFNLNTSGMYIVRINVKGKGSIAKKIIR